MWYMGRRTKFFLTPTCEVITNPITGRWFLRVLRLSVTPQILSVRILLHSRACHIPCPSHLLFKFTCQTSMRIPLHSRTCDIPCLSHPFLKFFCRTSMRIHIHSRACHIPCPSHPFFKFFNQNSVRIVLHSRACHIPCLSHPFLKFFCRTSMRIPLHSRACHIPCRSHLFGFYHSNNFWRVWKIIMPFTMYFFKPLVTVRISKRVFCSAVSVRCWSLSQGTATETNYSCLHTAFEGWKVRGEVHGLVLIWNTRNFLRD